MWKRLTLAFIAMLLAALALASEPALGAPSLGAPWLPPSQVSMSDAIAAG